MNMDGDLPKKIHQESGFSLIELMVALVIGLLIMIAIGSLFLNVNRSNLELAKTNSQIENGRFAMQLLQEDIAHAGFWGAFVPQFDDLTLATAPSDAPTAIPNPCLDYTTWTAGNVRNLIGIVMQVYGATSPSGSGCVTNLATNRKSNTDLLVVRHAETCVPGSANCESDTAGKLYFQSSQCELEIPVVPYKLATSAFTLHKRDCEGTGIPAALPITAGTVSEKRKFISNIYYIRDYARTVGDGIPTLMLSQFDLSGGILAHQDAVPLIEGIEGFTIELGVDLLSDTGANINYSDAVIWSDPLNLISPINRGDGVPEGNYIHCTDAVPCTLDQLTNVVAVKLFLLARADSVTPGYVDNKTYQLGSTVLGPFNDNFKRHVFSTTIRLVNISNRRETP